MPFMKGFASVDVSPLLADRAINMQPRVVIERAMLK
jgi:hypothetical protein